MAKIWYDMSVSRRQNDITALRNIKISSGKKATVRNKSGKVYRLIDHSNTVSRRDTNCDFLNNVYIYLYIQFSWIGQLAENTAIMSRRWNTSVFLRDKRNITKTNKTVFSICSVKQKNRTILAKMFKVNTVETSVYKLRKLKRLHQ